MKYGNEDKGLVFPESKQSTFTMIHDNILMIFSGCVSKALVCSVLIGMNDHFRRKKGNNWNGEFYQTHKQILKRFAGSISERTITETIKDAKNLGILTVSRKKEKNDQVKNWYKVDVPFVKWLIQSKSQNLLVSKSQNLLDKERYINIRKIYLKTISSKEENNASRLNKKRFIKTWIKSDSEITLNIKSKFNKIIKKSDKQDNSDSMSFNPYHKQNKQQYTLRLIDHQLYNELVALGATRHDETKNAYVHTMTKIHQLLDPGIRNPYSATRKIDDDYKIKQWTYDEIVEVFKFYMKTDEFKRYKNIGNFIYTQNIKGNKAFSPIVMYHKEMLMDTGRELDGDMKRLYTELERLHINTFLDNKDLKTIIRLLDLMCADYHTPANMYHMYYNNIIFAYTEFIESKIRLASFNPIYIKSEKFIKEFVAEYESRGLLIHR